MNANTGQSNQQDAEVQAGVRKRMVQVLLTILMQALVLFVSAGRIDWREAWVYIGIYLVGIAINAAVMLRRHRETVAARAETRGWKDWDKVISTLWGLMYFVFILVVAGLDTRFGWSGQISLIIEMVATVVFLMGGGLFSWAMATNAFFSTVVRVQTERGQVVCDTGPYQFVRHPGYVGAVLQSLTAPLVLGSLWALIPGGLAAVLITVRTALEDRTLQKELTGYSEYSERVCYRLLPGLW